jgi:hypothetical protein
MSLSISRRAALLLAGALTALCLALTLSPSRASATRFCDNQTVGTNQPCFGAPRNLSSASAMGSSHSVCVGVNSTSGPCSSGPGVYAVLNLGYTAMGATPWVAINVSGSTVVFGDTA